MMAECHSAGGVVLVTGGSGFIGAHLVRRLVARGSTLRVLARRDVTFDGAEVVRCDLAAGVPAAALQGVSTVVHLAGVTKALRPEEYTRGNVTATRNLAAACGPEVEFLHVSSLAAAGPSLNGGPRTDCDAPHPVSLYGRSKLAGEEALRESPAGRRAIILRPAVVYGPGDRDVLEFLRPVSLGLMVGIGTLEARFSLVYVEDLVDGILAALAKARGLRGREYFVASPEPVSWLEFGTVAAGVMGRRRVRRLALSPGLARAAGAMSEAAALLRGKPGILSRDKVREGVYSNWTCDVSPAVCDFGLAAATPLAEGLRTTLEWYRGAGWLSW